MTYEKFLEQWLAQNRHSDAIKVHYMDFLVNAKGIKIKM